MNALTDQLKQLNTCESAIKWVEENNLTELRDAWDKCYRGDWMLWLYKKLKPANLRELTLAKGHCANTVRYLMKDERSITAVDTAIAFGEGRATRDELDAAAYDAAAAYASLSNQNETADICRKYLTETLFI